MPMLIDVLTLTLLSTYLWSQYVIYIFILSFVMAALRTRCGHYIFTLWFLSSIFLFSSPNLSGRRLDVHHTLTHDVALVRI